MIIIRKNFSSKLLTKSNPSKMFRSNKYQNISQTIRRKRLKDRPNRYKFKFNDFYYKKFLLINTKLNVNTTY